MFQEVICCIDFIWFGKYIEVWWEKLVFKFYWELFFIFWFVIGGDVGMMQNFGY